MAADRAEHVALVIGPALAAGEWVVSDRYAGVDDRLPGLRAGPRPRRRWRELVGWATDGLAADLSVLVDVPVEVAAARLAAAGDGGGVDRMERLGPAVRGAGARGVPGPGGRGPRRTGSSSTARRTIAPLTAHIVASVRERLGDAPASAPVTDGASRAAELFAGVVGQEAAVAALRAAAANPVHAYLFRGPSGNGGLAAAHGFAAALLCPDGGCGECATCRAALAGTDPDLHVVRRSGASVSIADDPPGRRPGPAPAAARGAPGDRRARRASRWRCGRRRCSRRWRSRPGTPSSCCWPTTSSPELVTVASRCVEIAFPPVPRGGRGAWLTASGVPPDMAAVVADSSGGNPERARVMVDDPDVAARVALWTSVPDELSASGMTAAGLTRRVLESADRAVEPLRAAHAREIESLTAAAKEMGERGLPGRKEIVEQHQREERRFRTDALRAGLGVLARAYRGRVVRRSVGGLSDRGRSRRAERRRRPSG